MPIQLPLNPVIGQSIAFVPVADPGTVRWYGRILDRIGERWRVRLQNATHIIAFDPNTGLAMPFGRRMQVCWIGEPLKVRDYNEAIGLIQEKLDTEKETHGDNT